MDADNLTSILTIAVTCLLALAISIHFIKQFLINPRRNKSCYLNKESKPQHTFKRILADNTYSQFKHLKLQSPDSLSTEEPSNLHPYKGEISKVLKKPNLGFLEFLGEYYDQKVVLDIGGSYVWVENEVLLGELVEVLSKQSVFAVDTEQHSLRSFLGFTALIQISTIKEDYLVDTIKLHDIMGLLRPVFANPKICKVIKSTCNERLPHCYEHYYLFVLLIGEGKVFHGADNDVLWLQRDFHIYVVNLFDTAKACDVLSKPQRSLAYLLETYCDVATNKLLQREDWRQRPLPEEMITYAITDAHYLLYIAHSLCLELKLQKNENSSPGDNFHFLLEASRRSNAICLQLFAKDIEAYPGDLIASSMVSRCLNDQGNILSSNFGSKFQELVRRLCLWRDIMARIHDESVRFLLSEKAIIALAAKIPTTEKDICSIISRADSDAETTTFVSLQSPSPSPSPVVSCHLEDLLFLFQDKITNLDNIFELVIKKHLGAINGCRLSAYNYAFLSKTNLRLTNRPTSNRNGYRPSRQVAKRSSRAQFVKKFSCKSPVYHNCKIYADDGRLLCFCDRKKLEWYLNRNLAKLVEEDPPSIMLLFEPKGRPEDENNDFYIQSKKNICVGCGEGNHYLRYRVIPSCYRIHFPEHLKSHRSHDIVLLCVDCHEVAHAAAEKYKRQVADEFGIPLFIRKVVDFDNTQNIIASTFTNDTSEEIGVSPLELRTAAMALLRHGPRMPSQRFEALMQIVKKYYGGREISDEDLERALLFGMSPHERKKFEKKRGYTFKYQTGIINLSDERENIVGCNGTVSTNISETNWEQDSADLSRVEETRVITQTWCSDNRGDTTSFKAEIEIVPGMTDISISKHDDLFGSENLSKGTASPAHDRDFPMKHDSKLSLLGHGPHGKQVVEYLLKESGEDGVRDFCQRWRQVFVETLHPRFLPAGWDVMHSGRRAFGEFSVYNSAKRASGVAAAKDDMNTQLKI